VYVSWSAYLCLWRRRSIVIIHTDALDSPLLVILESLGRSDKITTAFSLTTMTYHLRKIRNYLRLEAVKWPFHFCLVVPSVALRSVPDRMFVYVLWNTDLGEERADAFLVFVDDGHVGRLVRW